jgi:hypothetical protein
MKHLTVAWSVKVTGYRVAATVMSNLGAEHWMCIVDTIFKWVVFLYFSRIQDPDSSKLGLDVDLSPKHHPSS